MKTIHELVQSKLIEAGIEVASWPIYIKFDGGDEEGLGGPYISGAKVNIGDFTVVGKAFLSGKLAEEIKQYAAAIKER